MPVRATRRSFPEVQRACGILKTWPQMRPLLAGHNSRLTFFSFVEQVVFNENRIWLHSVTGAS